ncbi:MAG: CZB domain-containing protein [Anaerolineae bacterium]|jgi:hypothetical protein|nr:CZB domain-containing protein [Anaerolineae bacterium]
MKVAFEGYLVDIIEKTLSQGGTASKPSQCQFLPIRDLWSFPKYPARTVIVPDTVNLIEAVRNFITQNESLLNEEDCWLGTWLHPQTREVYFDVATGMQDLDTARDVAHQAGIREGRLVVAMYNPLQNETIYLNEHLPASHKSTPGGS